MTFVRWLRAVWIRGSPAAGAILPWAGIVFMLAGALFGVRSWLFQRSQQRATATIDQNMVSFAPDGGLRYTPKLRFRDVTGRIVVVAGPSTEDEPEFAAGTTVPLLYPAGAPQRAIVANTGRLYGVSIGFGVLGVALFDTGWIVRLRLRRRAY